MGISKNRREAKVLDAGGGVEIRTCGLIDSSGVDFLPSGFRIDYQGKVVYIDPVALSDFKSADIILITHAHPDHFSKKAIREVKKSGTKIIGPLRMETKLKKLGGEVHCLKPGDEISFSGISCSAVPAYNKKNVFLWLKAHPGSGHNLGYVISFGETRIYHAGDTHFVDELKKMKGIELALVPVGKGKLTMDAAEAAALVNHINPKIAVPMHYELKRKDDVSRFAGMIAEGIKVEFAI